MYIRIAGYSPVRYLGKGGLLSANHRSARNSRFGRDGQRPTMDDTGKYLIHAEIIADGIVERSDVVGAIFGQTEGLLGDELDLRTLQDASKVGRLDVDVESEAGRSTGVVTIETNLDRVETATIAAALETISRIGPCRATVTVTDIEDTRAAKRREIVERAEELLLECFEGGLTSEEIIDAVRQRTQVEEITTYEELPAGPRVETADTIIVVEGRADVLALLKAGIENAIAVEGTDVPETVGALSHERTTTACLDGDRGGELIFQELMQVADLDYVTFAPDGRAIEDLNPPTVRTTLRQKVPVERTDAMPDQELTEEAATTSADGAGVLTVTEQSADPAVEESATTVPEHGQAVVGADTARLLDADAERLEEVPSGDLFEAIEETEVVPATVVVDAAVSQRLLDVAAQQGVRRVIGTELGAFTKRPTDVRVQTIEDLV